MTGATDDPSIENMAIWVFHLLWFRAISLLTLAPPMAAWCTGPMVPAWLKILALILAASIVVSAFSSAAEFLLLPLLAAVLIAMPGKDRERPRLVKAFPWFLVLSWLVALALLAADLMDKQLVPPEAHQPTAVEIWATLLTAPALLAAFLREKPAFQWLLLASSVFFIGHEAWVFSSEPRTMRTILALAGNCTFQVTLTVYLILKSPKRAASSRSSNAAKSASAG